MGRKRERKETHKHGLAATLLDPTLGLKTGSVPGGGRAPRPDYEVAEEDDYAEADTRGPQVSDALADRIRSSASAQRAELEAEENEAERGAALGDQGREGLALLGSALAKNTKSSRKAKKAKKISTSANRSDSGSEDEDDDSRGRMWEVEEVDGEIWDGDGEEDESTLWAEYNREIAGVSADDEAALAAFMNPGGASASRSLADVIMNKIREHQAGSGLPTLPEAGEEDRDPARMPLPAHLDPRVVEVYRGVGALLSRYTAGKIPKAFKVVPNLDNWEEVLYLTSPHDWTPQAVMQATRLFASNLNAKMAQRFYSLVLLPRFRTEIEDHRKIHVTTFQALKKAFYKPAAWYKGILLPLCMSRTCTLREAVILSAVLRRVHVPVLHSAAALLRLAEMEYGGTTSFFIRVLLDKKYALPYRVLDAMVEHFMRFEKEWRQLPVVWHQSLLTFVQRYKQEIRAEDKERLRLLCRTQHHYQITPEVVRELNLSASRGQKGMVMATTAASVGGRSAVGVENLRKLPPILIMDQD